MSIVAMTMFFNIHNAFLKKLLFVTSDALFNWVVTARSASRRTDSMFLNKSFLDGIAIRYMTQVCVYACVR